jgi:hypothetical protein
MPNCKNNVLILAAGDLRNKFHYLKSNSPSPALIPIHTIPLISYVVKCYLDNPDLNIYLVTNEEYVSHIKSELDLKRLNINICSISKTSGVVETLDFALRKIPHSPETIVHPVTTIMLCEPQCNDVYIADKLSYNYDWSNISVSESGKINFLPKDKPINKSGFAFTGVFRCKTIDLLEVLQGVEVENDLLAVVEKLAKRVSLNYKKIDWLDCGHEINYYELKTKIIASRFFNNLKLVGNGVVRKSSSKKSKMKAEKLFISMLPPDLKNYFPRLQDANIDVSGYYDMEYYGYPNVSELMLYWGLQNIHWERIFAGFATILSDFKQYNHSIGLSCYSDFYISRLKHRLYLFKNQSKINRHLFENSLVVNKTKCKTLQCLMPLIEKKIKSLYCEDDFCVMHGDFCFNNILFDLQSGIIRLIDPRGCFGEKCTGIYGDFKYDLAKLAHSSVGYYDYIVNNIFKLAGDELEYSYKFNVRENHEVIARETKKLIGDFSYNFDDIIFLVGILFVSMCPLHSDQEEKQKIMFLHGVKILNEVVS